MIQSRTNKINHNGFEITHICKPRLKNSYISVSKDGVLLKTPRVSDSYIKKLLLEKEQWIHKKLIELKSRIYVDKTLSDETIAKEYLKSRVEYYSKLMGLKYSSLKFRKMKRRWGSCSSNRIITLNTYLYNTPQEQIDYVVIHELAHLVHMNHSKEFHRLVDKYMPLSKDLKSIQSQFYLLQ
ncbi:M48 family metallopeptidase [Sulfurimonas sp.]|uniref:M48 family metallopeptidase n=1 Tax=Sulfurimonas sp. TaxID=2022749 RepID=UPI00356B59B2